MNEEEFYKHKRVYNAGIKLHGREYISASHIEHGIHGIKSIKAKVDTNINEKQRVESN